MAGDVEAPQPTQPTDAQQRHEAQMLGYVLGLFFFYVLHDALQERAFRTPGFEFGWFMTAVEIGTMFVCALAWEGGLAALRSRREADDGAAATPAAARNYLALLVFAIALSQGTGSVALQHVNYPVKVAFKSCKLVPTMAFSRYIVRDGKRYGVDDYAAALFMCVGLALLSAADLAAHAERDTQAAGLMLLVVAVCSDAVIPNLQEKLLREVAKGSDLGVPVTPQQFMFGTELLLQNSNLDGNIKLMIRETVHKADAKMIPKDIPKSRFTAFSSHSPLNNPLKGQDTSTPSIDCTKV